MEKYFEETLARLYEVLNRLDRAGLILNSTKCRFFKSQIKFLGHIMDDEGGRSNPEKTKALMQWPTPTIVKELQSSVIGAGYWRSYIKSYSGIIAPLTALVKKIAEVFLWRPSGKRVQRNK